MTPCRMSLSNSNAIFPLHFSTKYSPAMSGTELDSGGFDFLFFAPLRAIQPPHHRLKDPSS